MARTRPRRDLDVDVYTLACERMAHTMEVFDRVLVAFSGGKDSTAVLNVALDVARSDPRYERHLPLRVRFWDEEAIPVETEQYVRRIAAREDVALEWLCLPVKHRNACSPTAPWWWPWAPEAEDLWCRPLPPEAITTWPGFPIDPPGARLSIPDADGLACPPEKGNHAILMGIRAQESITRFRAVTWRRHDNYLIKWDQGTSRGNVWKSYPVYDWTTTDIWTAVALKDWDHNAAYDRLEMAGVPRIQQRCSPAFGEEPLQKLHTYAAAFPEVWARMVSRVPGVGAAARYARTELYAYGSRPPKPAGLPWPEFIAHHLRRFPPSDRRIAAGRVRYWLAGHYRRTTHPVVENAPHPETGVSWNHLLSIAMRGDFKNRRQAAAHLQMDGHGRAVPRMWHRYADELAQILREDRFTELAAPSPAPADPYDLIPAYARDDPETDP